MTRGPARKRALVIGAQGFVGKHLVPFLRSQGDVVLEATREKDGAGSFGLDVVDRDAAVRVIAEAQPDVVYHLAAMSFVPDSQARPLAAFQVNCQGALNVLEGVRRAPGEPRVIFVSTGEVYGLVRPEEVPVVEDQPLDPRNPYAGAKAALELTLRGLRGIPATPDFVIARSFNHTGPGQSPLFVCSDFARQVARVEAGLAEPVIKVGNLEARRDFCDVRDVVRAYRLLAEHGESGQVYNVASGQHRAIRDVLDYLRSRVSAEIRVEVDPSRLRPSDMPVFAGDVSRLRDCTGWEPRFAFEETLDDLLASWRDAIRH